MCASLGDYLCPMYKIINVNIAMLQCMLFHNVKRYIDSLLSRIHVNITKMLYFHVHFVAIRVILQVRVDKTFALY